MPSVDSGPPISDLQLGKSLLPGGIATALSCSFLGPLAGAGREPPQNTTGLAAVCLCLRMAPGTHMLQGGSVMSQPLFPTLRRLGCPLSPPQSFCLFPGPGSRSPHVPMQLSRSVGAALPLQFPVHGWLRPPPGPSSAGVGQAPRFPPLYEAPLRQAHYNFL